jgi:hypothetical protein
MYKNNSNRYRKSQSHKQNKNCLRLAGVAGFEPAVTESESVALPLGDTPSINQNRENGGLGRVRTYDLTIKSRLLYQLSY